MSPCQREQRWAVSADMLVKRSTYRRVPSSPQLLLSRPKFQSETLAFSQFSLAVYEGHCFHIKWKPFLLWIRHLSLLSILGPKSAQVQNLYPLLYTQSQKIHMEFSFGLKRPQRSAKAHTRFLPRSLRFCLRGLMQELFWRFSTRTLSVTSLVNRAHKASTE